VGLLGGDDDGPRPAIFDELAQSLLGVLFGQDAHAREVLLAGQFVKAGTDGGVRPPRTERRGETDIDGVAQVVYPGAQVFPGVRVYGLVNSHAATLVAWGCWG